ncbi:MAG: taurine catabolism dioxygenase TauD [Rhodospirillaceae bacterium]|nr:taurine catabolism dioxygenase TauD [Rhodospirillaceae bacterium]|tara:strand:+ start:3915 stop:4745 length:831 start_codon:yes stop_codon:yes gene_type:complete
MSIIVTPLSDALGAAVTGIDLSQPVNEQTLSDIKQAWYEHVILVFPNQDISDEEQENFCLNFGELERVRTIDAGSETPHVMMITNVKELDKPTALPDGEMMFHYDQCYYEQPCMGATLYAIEIPDVGGNTLFANCTKAYEALSHDWKQRLDGLRALNYYDYGLTPTMRPEEMNPDVPQWTHPVVRTHSETGRKAIYVSRLMSMRIEGLPEEESNEILNFLFDQMEKPEYIYEHVWSKGDLMMWDNRCSVHARTHFSPNARRMMRRVTVRDPKPVAA